MSRKHPDFARSESLSAIDRKTFSTNFDGQIFNDNPQLFSSFLREFGVAIKRDARSVDMICEPYQEVVDVDFLSIYDFIKQEIMPEKISQLKSFIDRKSEKYESKEAFEKNFALNFIFYVGKDQFCRVCDHVSTENLERKIDKTLDLREEMIASCRRFFGIDLASKKSGTDEELLPDDVAQVKNKAIAIAVEGFFKREAASAIVDAKATSLENIRPNTR